MGERWLVTGATGFVGGALVRALVADDDDVHVIVRRAADDPLVRALPAAVVVQHHDGSMAGMNALVAAARPDVVVHLASRFVVEHTPDDVGPLVADNLLFGTQLLEGMRAAGVTRFVTIGSAFQHYRDAEYSPTSLYAATKQAFDALLVYFVEAHAVRAVTLQFTDTYGPGDTRRKLIPIMLDAERDGRRMAMVPAEVPMDLVHVSDAVAAIRVAAERTTRAEGGAIEGGTERFAVRSNSGLTVGGLFEAWHAARGRAIAVDWGVRPVRAREMLAPWTEGTVLPGWSPRIALHDGLAAL